MPFVAVLWCDLMRYRLPSDKRTIMREYAAADLEHDVDVENRCELRCQCFLVKNHKSKCDFVGGRGLSADSQEKVMGAL